jgi:hypothetical protein
VLRRSVGRTDRLRLSYRPDGDVRVAGLAGLQYREFLAMLLPFYCSFGVVGAAGALAEIHGDTSEQRALQAWPPCIRTRRRWRRCQLGYKGWMQVAKFFDRQNGLNERCWWRAMDRSASGPDAYPYALSAQSTLRLLSGQPLERAVDLGSDGWADSIRLTPSRIQSMACARRQSPEARLDG